MTKYIIIQIKDLPLEILEGPLTQHIKKQL